MLHWRLKTNLYQNSYESQALNKDPPPKKVESKYIPKTWEMAQCVKVIVTKPDDLTSIPGPMGKKVTPADFSLLSTQNVTWYSAPPHK